MKRAAHIQFHNLPGLCCSLCLSPPDARDTISSQELAGSQSLPAASRQTALPAGNWLGLPSYSAGRHGFSISCPLSRKATAACRCCRLPWAEYCRDCGRDDIRRLPRTSKQRSAWHDGQQGRLRVLSLLQPRARPSKVQPNHSQAARWPVSSALAAGSPQQHCGPRHWLPCPGKTYAVLPILSTPPQNGRPRWAGSKAYQSTSSSSPSRPVQLHQGYGN